MPRQKRFAGTNPNCAVRTLITQIMRLLTEATIQPCHRRRPIISVEVTVRMQER
jgi:hypothetical protein